jgi:SAM-dependent methyltransferase
LPLMRRVHQDQVHSRRVAVLTKHIADLLPPAASVLDIGAGDGLLGKMVLTLRPDLRWTAVDTLARPAAHVPVQIFDGKVLPFPDKSFDVALFVDVLHHTGDPMVMLREAVRISRAVVIKDHLRKGFLAGPTLRFMDWVGNSAWGVSLPYNYWSEDQWNGAARALRLTSKSEIRSLALYPWWADWWFGRSLHFIARFEAESSPAPAGG